MSEDVRIIKNKRLIETEFIKLLGREDFSKITTQNICNASLTSRSTFYSHYLDKYDLLEKIVDRYTNIIRQVVEERFTFSAKIDFESTFQTIINTYLEHKEPLKILMKVHVPNSDLREKVEGIFYQQCYNFLENRQLKTNVPISLMAKLYMSNVLILMGWVLDHGIDNQTACYVTKLQEYILNSL